MSLQYISYSSRGGGGVQTYPTFSAFPATAADGQLALALDTDALYAFNTGSMTWVVIGGGTSVLSVGALDGQAANAFGATIATNSLFLQSASATFPGLVNNTTQSFSGNKTFTGTIGASNLSGTNTGDVTIGMASGLSLAGQVLSLQLSRATLTGALSSADWTTFNGKQAAGNYITALTGDVTAAGPGSAAATIANSAVTNAKMANMADATVKGNTSGGSAAPSDLALGAVTEATSSVLTLVGWTNATIGSPTIQVKLATTSQSGYLSSTDWNTFNNKQPALGFTPENSANKGITNGYAPLDGAAKVPYANLPSAIMTYLGAWNASTNTPTLADGTGDTGDTYRVSVAGTQNLGSGAQTFFVGDFVIYDGAIWQRSPAADGVTSVNGFTGAVVLTQGNLTDAGTDGIVITGGTNAVWGSGTSIAQHVADSTHNGYLSSTDWSTFNSKQAAFTIGALDAQTANAQGLSFVANVLSQQSATAAFPGLVNTSAQTFGGTKTFAQIIDNGLTANTVVYADISSQLTSSAVTPTELSYLSGATSSIQTQLGDKQAINPGDIADTSFAAANNQVAAADVTGFAFANSTVRSFKALVSIYINATSSLYETMSIHGIQKGASWAISIGEGAGDASGIDFTITNAGQIQYTSGSSAGFVSSTIRFRAWTTQV